MLYLVEDGHGDQLDGQAEQKKFIRTESLLARGSSQSVTIRLDLNVLHVVQQNGVANNVKPDSGCTENEWSS
jgi:hypothetical protein